MKSKRKIFLVILVLSLILYTCIEPYDPNLKEYESLLVVNALITNLKGANYVTLSRTFETPDGVAEMVTGATVSVYDDLGNIALLTEITPGVYITDSLTFTGTIGRTYILHIETADRKMYVSEACIMNGARQINDLYYEKAQQTLDDGEIQEGIRIFIDAKDENSTQYYRWTYDEFWKFRVPYAPEYEYISQTEINHIEAKNVYCWKNASSTDIIIKSVETGTNGEFIKKPVLFIPSDASDRFTIQYYVNITQLSLSKEEYEYWDLLQQNNQTGGDIFDKQPVSISGNIHNIGDSDEKVLGYFQVSGAAQKSMYITYNEIRSLELPKYQYDCDVIIIGPVDYTELGEPMTFDRIYALFTRGNYLFVAPVYGEFNVLERLMFVNKPCADCTYTGVLDPPEFWIELN